MPLIMRPLQGELINIYEKGKKGNASPKLVATKTAQSYFNYVSSGINAGGGAFTAMPGSSALGQDLGDILSKSSPAGDLTAMKMAKAFDTCLQTFLSVHQTTITTTAGLPGLQSNLQRLLKSPNPTTTLFCMDFSNYLHTYTLAAIVIGVVPDTPGVPFTGPIS